jgi:hypothetical protein
MTEDNGDHLSVPIADKSLAPFKRLQQSTRWQNRCKEPTRCISLVPSCHKISTLTTTDTVDIGLQQRSATQSSTSSPTVDSEASDISVRTALNAENYR